MKTLSRISLAASAATYLLIFVGGLARVSGVGDLPAGSQQSAALAWLDPLQRLTGLGVGVLTLLAAGLALRQVWRTRATGMALGTRRDVTLPLLAALPLAGATIGLGEWLRTAVNPDLVTLQLVLAVALATSLLAAAMRAATQTDAATTASPVAIRLSHVVLLIGGLTLVQMVLGSFVRGQVDWLLLHRPEFVGREILQNIGGIKHLHMILGMGLAAVSYGLAWRLMRQREHLTPAALYVGRVLMALIFVQVMLGFSFGAFGLGSLAKVFHLWIAAISVGLWTVLAVLLRSGDALPLPRPRVAMGWSAGGLATASGMALLAVVTIAQAEEAKATLPIYGEAPAFSFPAARGGEFGSDGMRGKTTILAFMFTRCPSICPVQTQRMSELHQAYAGAEDLQFVCITVDPAYDTLPVLAEYGAKWGATDNWYFLRGELEPAQTVAGPDGFRLMDDFPNHSPNFVLIDADLQVRGYYNSLQEDAVVLLRKDLTRLLGEAQARD